MEKVVVLGGAGYIGSVLVRELLDKGYKVRVVDRFFWGSHGLKGVEKQIELIMADVRALDLYVFEGSDFVINLAGVSGDSQAKMDPSGAYESNTIAAEQSTRLAMSAGVKRYLYASTSAVYEGAAKGAEGVLDEDTFLSPENPYPRSKYLAEQAILSLSNANFVTASLRPGNVYGFSLHLRYDMVVNAFVKDSLSKGVIRLSYGGETWRPFVHVRDVAGSYIACLEAPVKNVAGQAFNVVYDNFRISELALRVREALTRAGVRADIHVDYSAKDTRSIKLSGTKLEKATGFRPSIGPEEAVYELVLKIKEHEYTDFDHPKYYPARWLALLNYANRLIELGGPFKGSGQCCVRLEDLPDLPA